MKEYVAHERMKPGRPPTIDHVPTLENFRVLRVLDLEDRDLSYGCSLKYIGNLLHLRYLGLRKTCIDELPQEIGKLRLLQILDIRGNKISSLLVTIVLLTHLLCLRIDHKTRVPKGIGRLKNLEDFSSLGIGYSSRYIVEELGHITELKVLRISLMKWNNFLDKSLVDCLNKMHKIQSLRIEVCSGECNLDGWIMVTPQHLHRLVLWGSCWLSTLPAWVNPSLLLDLYFLCIRVRELRQEDLQILGRLPALRLLNLTVDHEDLGIRGRFVVRACSFPCLVSCALQGFGGPVVFRQGAMPRLVLLWLEFHVQEARETRSSFNLDLPSLKNFYVRFLSRGASVDEVEEAKAAVRHAVEAHPNNPTLITY